jgi:hypothetical protein
LCCLVAVVCFAWTLLFVLGYCCLCCLVAVLCCLVAIICFAWVLLFVLLG